MTFWGFFSFVQTSSKSDGWRVKCRKYWRGGGGVGGCVGGCRITTCYPLALCHAPMSLDTHLMGLLWGQCASRAKLPFSVCACVITLTSDVSDVRQPVRQAATRLNWSGGNRTVKSSGFKYKSWRAPLVRWCSTKSVWELKCDDAE